MKAILFRRLPPGIRKPRIESELYFSGWTLMKSGDIVQEPYLVNQHAALQPQRFIFMSNENRPLSPFMIGPSYRPQITSMLSILHRATGAALGVGAIVFAWWLLAVASGVGAFETFQNFRQSFLGQFMLFGWLFSFVYHFLNGVRHLKWDMGYGLEMKSVYRTGYVVVGGSLLLTVLIWGGFGR